MMSFSLSNNVLGTTPEEIETNAKYAISVARRIGATTFLVWEDIRDVKPNAIFLFIASLKAVVAIVDGKVLTE